MMFRNALFTFTLTSLGVSASPVKAREASPTTILPVPESTETTSPVFNWSVGWKPKFPIHESCNSTQRAQLQEALDEAVQLAQHARDHLLRFGHKSDFVQKYFGNGSTSAPIGWFDRIIAADKSDMTFRCDDPDRNCETQDGYAGHWRGENATSETVICDLSFTNRLPLSAVCMQGYTVASWKLNTYWATDLVHRVLHVPAISEGLVEHHSEGYAGALQLAKEQPELSGFDSDVLQYFAIDVWAYDIAAPGVGCTGEAAQEPPKDEPTNTTSGAPSATSEAPKECHTHDDGVVHCS